MKSISRASTALLLFLATTVATSAEVRRKVPERFTGDWCSTIQSDPEETRESDITIGESEIVYYTASGKILAVAAVKDQLALIVELNIDGDIRVATHLYDISPDGKQIVEGLEDGTLRTRKRCKR